MARSTASGSNQLELGVDNGGLVGGQGADDVLPDDRGGAVAAIQPSTVSNRGSGHLARFFDTKTGGHFFTASADEQAALQAARPDLRLEGNGFATDDASTAGTSNVFRFFNTKDGGHFFTADANERDSLLQSRPDLAYEGVAFQEHAAPAAGYVPVYRFFDKNDGGHLFTSGAAERDNLIATRLDLTNEGIAFYAPAG